AWPYYGTEMYRIAREKGYLLKEDGIDLEQGLLNMEAMIRTPEFTPAQVYKYQRIIQGDFDVRLLLGLLRQRPLDVIRGFSLHPAITMKFFFRKYVLRVRG
ncbi:MAG: hypothetical protein LUP94_02320, partial [Candidatus Methanomethylicus sp.]|nr:hypothetical protein [Candidatus Methanomethylicus sp.]